MSDDVEIPTGPATPAEVDAIRKALETGQAKAYIDLDVTDATPGDLPFVRIYPSKRVQLRSGVERVIPTVVYRHATAEDRANYLQAERAALGL